VVVGALAVGVAAGSHDASPATTTARPGSTEQDRVRGGDGGTERGLGATEAAWTSPDGRTMAMLDGQGPRAMGEIGRDITITSINGTKLALETDDGWTRTIDAAGATVTKGGKTVALTALEVGDQVTFRQTRAADGTVTITAVSVVQPTVSGTVATVSGSTVTVTARDGATRTVVLTDGTTYAVGRADATRAAVVVGVRIHATGSLGEDGRLTATSVVVAPATAAGTVKEKSGDSITLAGRDGTTSVVRVTASTTYRVAGVESPTLADVAVGAVVLASGTTNADGSLTAATVLARPAGEDGGPGGGRGHGRGPGGLPGWAPDDRAAPSSSPLPSGEGTSS
jgi:hypothetical protein